MTTNAHGLDAILGTLQTRRAELAKTAAAKVAERGDTSHPASSAPDSTGDACTGARSSENTSDSKAQNPLNPDTAGAATGIAPVAGSLGVDAKDATEAPADKPDTSGKSEMGAQDTTHPTKSARAFLSDRIKAAKAAEKVAGSEETSEKVAAEKFASYCEGLVKECPDDFAAGCKFAMEVLASVVQAAQAKHAAMEGAEGGMPVEGLPAEGGMPAEGSEDELAQLAAELEAAGVTPEQLAGALQDGEAGQAGPEDAQQVAALEEAMQAEGMSPEELAGAVGAEGGDPAAAEMASEASAKAASDKEAHAKLVNELRAQIRTIKAAKAKK